MNGSNETYKLFANFYDLYVGRFNADFEFYKSFCSKADKIIEIGCGTGRILNVLLEQGCKVTGIDISQDMLNRADEKLKHWINRGDLSLINHDFSIDKLNDKFDKALLTFYTFNYILDNPDVFISNVHDSLDDEGLLLLDMFYPNSLFDKSIDDRWIDKEFIFDGMAIKIHDNRTMIDDIEYRQQIFNINDSKTKIDTKRKYYSPIVLRDILKLAGFKEIEFSYAYDFYGFKAMIDETRLKNNYIVKAKK